MSKKQYVAWIRSSGPESAMSLAVQGDAIFTYITQQNGQIAKTFLVRKPAAEEFKEMLDYVRKNADSISGVLVYSVDRISRSIHRYIELERLRSDCGVPLIVVGGSSVGVDGSDGVKVQIAYMSYVHST